MSLILLVLLALQDPKVPDGFAIEKISPADVAFPMFGCLDDRGRLYVTESSGGDLYLELQKQVRKCRIRRIDGATSTVFAEGLVPSMGLAWRDGKLYAADPPELITLEDTDDDGVADKRTVLVKGFGHQDNGSLHGLVFGPDGLLYMTTGEPDGYDLPAKGGGRVKGTSGALLRCKPDGTDFEVLARGFVNLVEVVFLPEGDILGTDNWWQKPVGGVRDAIMHLVPGGLYPYVPDQGTKQPVTGVELPAAGLFPAVALSGLVRYEALQLDPAWHGQLFSAQHNTRAVQRHKLSPRGSSYAIESFDFVTSENPDFHPSDVLVAPDGALLVVDTGGWYVEHCPTGKIRKSFAPGGIWRVRALAPRQDEEARMMLMAERQLSRLRKDDAVLRKLFDSGSFSLEAARAAGLRGAFAPELANLLDHKEPLVRRAAAESLALAGTKAEIPALVEALAEDVDPFLEHAIVHALSRIGVTEAAMKHEHPRVRKAALFLLDAPRDAVLAAIGDPDRELRAAALRLLQKRKEWAADALGLVKAWIEKPADPAALRGCVLAFQADPAIQKAVADGLSGPARGLLLETIAETTLKDFPKSWEAGLRAAIPDPAAVRAIAALQLTMFDDALAGMLDLEALRAIVPRKPKLEAKAVDFLLARLADRGDAPGRLAASEILRRAQLKDSDLVLALRAIKGDPLISPSVLMAALREVTDAANALAVEVADAVRAGWRPSEKEFDDAIRRLPEEARGFCEPVKEILKKAAEENKAKIAKHEGLLLNGDAARGREVFFNKKAACGQCHAIGAEGGRVGPDLTKIGAIRAGRDLLESILVPSSTFAQNYEPYAVATVDGDVLSGLIARQTADAVTLRDASGKETRVRRDRIKDMKRAEKSVMPDNLEQAMSEQEFRDLLAYLQSLK